MSSAVYQQLSQLTLAYQQQYQQQYQCWPQQPRQEEASPCRVAQDNQYDYWQAVTLAELQPLSAVERAVDLRLRSEIHDYFGWQYAGNLTVIDHQQRQFLLLQAWSATDFVDLQENMIGHLLMQQRLRLSPSCFLATTADDSQLVSLCNLTGYVYLETLARRRADYQREILATNLLEWLLQLTVKVVVK